MTDYTDFSSKTSEQKGNYLAINITSADPDAEVYFKYEGSSKGEVKMPKDDKAAVIRVTDKTKGIKVRAVKSDHETTVTYSLNHLTLDPAT